jgi:hypothetical protein
MDLAATLTTDHQPRAHPRVPLALPGRGPSILGHLSRALSRVPGGASGPLGDVSRETLARPFPHLTPSAGASRGLLRPPCGPPLPPQPLELGSPKSCQRRGLGARADPRQGACGGPRGPLGGARDTPTPTHTHTHNVGVKKLGKKLGSVPARTATPRGGSRGQCPGRARARPGAEQAPRVRTGGQGLAQVQGCARTNLGHAPHFTIAVTPRSCTRLHMARGGDRRPVPQRRSRAARPARATRRSGLYREIRSSADLTRLTGSDTGGLTGMRR